MMPNEPLRDVMGRTIRNLEFVERNAAPTGPFEVTQLINSFIGALAHPWEQLKAELNDMPLSDAAGWPIVRKELVNDADPDSVGELVRLLRNAIAHGNIDFLPGSKAGDEFLADASSTNSALVCSPDSACPVCAAPNSAAPDMTKRNWRRFMLP